MATAYSSWWPDTQIFRSTDSGGTWTQAWSYTSYPNRENRYTMDVSSSPWLTWGANPSPPEQTPKLGWMTEALEIDPFDSDRMMYGTGATIYGSENLTNWDDDTSFTITPMVRGLEETAVNDLISPPSGAPLVSALGDIGGFRHTDLTKVPSMMFTSPNFTTTTSLDYAETNPNTVVRVGDLDSGPHVAFSTDNGANWFAGTDPSGVSGGGRRQPLRVEPAGRRRALRDRLRYVLVGVVGHPGGSDRRVRPGGPEDVLRFQVREVLRQYGRRRDLHRVGGDRAPRR